VKGDKVDLLDPNDKKWVVGHGQVEGIVGDLNHFLKVEGLCRVAMWHVVEGQIELFEPNDNDDPPQRLLRDVEGTTPLWEE
jgi:hypothetical protein